MYWVSWLELALSRSSRSLFKFWMVTSSLLMLRLVCLRLFSKDLILFWDASSAFLTVISSFFKLKSSSSTAAFAVRSLSMMESLSRTSLTRASSSFSSRRNSVCSVRFSSLTFFNLSFRFLTSSLRLSLSFLRVFISDSMIASLCTLLLRSDSKAFLCFFRSFTSFSSSWTLFFWSSSLRSNPFLSDLRPSAVALAEMMSRFASASSFCNFLIFSLSSALALSFFAMLFLSPSFTFSCWLTFAWRSLISAFAFTFLLFASFKFSLSWALCLRAAASWLSRLSIFPWTLYRSSSAFSLSFCAASRSFSFCARSLCATAISRSRSAFSPSSFGIRSCKLVISSLAASSSAFSLSTSLVRSLFSSILIFILRFAISFSSSAFFSCSASSWLSLSPARLIKSW